MSKLIRFSVPLSEADHAYLARQAKRKRCSKSQVVRQAIHASEGYQYDEQVQDLKRKLEEARDGR